MDAWKGAMKRKEGKGRRKWKVGRVGQGRMEGREDTVGKQGKARKGRKEKWIGKEDIEGKGGKKVGKEGKGG